MNRFLQITPALTSATSTVRETEGLLACIELVRKTDGLMARDRGTTQKRTAHRQ